ncbi:MAG: hypothetical protein ACR2FJ_09195 [Qipengyuania sp.]
MKTQFCLAISTLALAAVPAQSQLLGGGGGVTGTLSGTINSTIRTTTTTIDSATRGSARGSASTRGSQRADARSGSVDLSREIDGDAAASTAQLLSNPIGPVGAQADGAGSASGSGNAGAQLIGTDAVGALAGQGAAQVRGAASSAQGLAGNAAGGAQGMAGGPPATVTGSGSGNGSGSGSATGGLGQSMLAAAGSGAAAGEGAFAIAPGMPVFTPSGAPLVKVREVVADSRGQVQQVVVQSGSARQAIPAGNLTASGSALIAGSGSGSVSSGSEGERPSPESDREQ